MCSGDSGGCWGKPHLCADRRDPHTSDPAERQVAEMSVEYDVLSTRKRRKSAREGEKFAWAQKKMSGKLHALMMAIPTSRAGRGRWRVEFTAFSLFRWSASDV